LFDIDGLIAGCDRFLIVKRLRVDMIAVVVGGGRGRLGGWRYQEFGRLIIDPHDGGDW
jgi:hypothetical protein